MGVVDLFAIPIAQALKTEVHLITRKTSMHLIPRLMHAHLVFAVRSVGKSESGDSVPKYGKLTWAGEGGDIRSSLYTVPKYGGQNLWGKGNKVSCHTRPNHNHWARHNLIQVKTRVYWVSIG